MISGRVINGTHRNTPEWNHLHPERFCFKERVPLIYDFLGGEPPVVVKPGETTLASNGDFACADLNTTALLISLRDYRESLPGPSEDDPRDIFERRPLF